MDTDSINPISGDRLVGKETWSAKMYNIRGVSRDRASCAFLLNCGSFYLPVASRRLPLRRI